MSREKQNLGTYVSGSLASDDEGLAVGMAPPAGPSCRKQNEDFEAAMKRAGYQPTGPKIGNQSDTAS